MCEVIVVWSYCMLSLCVKLLCKEAGGAGGGEGARDTESKTRTPHKVVGKNTLPFPFPCSCESFGQGVKPTLGKTIRGNKNDNVWKKHLKGLGVFTRSLIIGVAPVSVTDGPCGERREKITQLICNIYAIKNIYIYIYIHILIINI